MLNAKSILSLSIFIIFKLIYTVSTFSRTRQNSKRGIARKRFLGIPLLNLKQNQLTNKNCMPKLNAIYCILL